MNPIQLDSSAFFEVMQHAFDRAAVLHDMRRAGFLVEWAMTDEELAAAPQEVRDEFDRLMMLRRLTR